MQDSNTDKYENARYFLFTFIVFCFCGSVYMKLFDKKLFGMIDFIPVSGLSFSLTIGLLIDFALRIKPNLYAIPPVLLSLKLASILLNYVGPRWLAALMSNSGSLFWPITGMLFIRSTLAMGKSESLITRVSMVGCGLFLLLTVLPEYSIYFPGIFPTWMFMGIFLGIFFFLLLADFSGFRNIQQSFRIENGYIQWGMLVVSVKFFGDYVFV